MSIQEALQPAAADPKLDPRRWWIVCVVVLAQFMFVVDVFIVNVAIPAIQLNLHASSGQIQLVLAAYQLAYAVLLFSAPAPRSIWRIVGLKSRLSVATR